MALASVIIPTYNRADLVCHAIRSVLDQTYSDWECIVVDDGSTDNTRDAVATFDDRRIRYIYQDNTKLPGARNTGIRASSGPYVAFLDSDDRFLPHKLELQVLALQRDPQAGLVASGSIEVDKSGAPLRTLKPWLLQSELTLDDWLYSCPFAPSDVLIRREWLDRVGLFDPQQYYVEDWDLWLRMSYAGCRMIWEPAIVELRTVHDGSMVRNAEAMGAGLFRLLEKFFAQPDLPDRLRQQHDRVIARAHLFAAVRAYGAGAASTGQKHLSVAIQMDPALLDDDPPVVLQSLASTALTHQVRDTDQYIADVCASLPSVHAQLARSPRQLRAMIRAASAFEARASNRRWQARVDAAKTLAADPNWLRNRGLLGILIKP